MLDLELHVLLREHGQLFLPGQVAFAGDPVGRLLGPGRDAEPVGDGVVVVGMRAKLVRQEFLVALQ
jgi:hypothetical protein